MSEEIQQIHQQRVDSVYNYLLRLVRMREELERIKLEIAAAEIELDRLLGR